MWIDYPSEEVLGGLTDFPFDLDEQEDSHFYTIDIGDIGGEERAVSKLIDNLLLYDKYRVFGVSLQSIVEDKLARLISVNDFDVIAKKVRSMDESVYLWNDHYGIKITRDYYEWYIGCTFFLFTKIDAVLNITKIAMPCDIFDNCPKELGGINKLYDWKQDDYLDKLMKMIDSQELSLAELIKKPSVDWYELLKPDGIDPEASWAQIDIE